ncbi:MAG: hypothetical protein WC373_11765 [Smithella sp.]
MISMDVSTLIFMVITMAVIAAAFYSGYNIGKKIDKAHIETTKPKLFSKKENELHERDPWDEMRLDQEERPKVVQTVEAGHE